MIVCVLPGQERRSRWAAQGGADEGVSEGNSLINQMRDKDTGLGLALPYFHLQKGSAPSGALINLCEEVSEFFY